MTQAIERLLVVGLFGAIAFWTLTDIRRHLREGEIRTWPQWGVPSGVAVRGRDTFAYWSMIVGKTVGAVAAAILAAAYCYYSATS